MSASWPGAGAHVTTSVRTVMAAHMRAVHTYDALETSRHYLACGFRAVLA